MDFTVWNKYLNTMKSLILSRIRNLIKSKYNESMGSSCSKMLRRPRKSEMNPNQAHMKNYLASLKTIRRLHGGPMWTGSCCEADTHPHNHEVPRPSKKGRKQILSITRRFLNSDEYCYLPASQLNIPQEVPLRCMIDPGVRIRPPLPPVKRNIVIRYYYDNESAPNGSENSLPVSQDHESDTCITSNEIQLNPSENTDSRQVRFESSEEKSTSDHNVQRLPSVNEGIETDSKAVKNNISSDNVATSTNEEPDEPDTKDGGEVQGVKIVRFENVIDQESTSQASLEERILNDYLQSSKKRERRRRHERIPSEKLDFDEDVSITSSDDGAELNLPLAKELKYLSSYGRDDDKLALLEYRTRKEQLMLTSLRIRNPDLGLGEVESKSAVAKEDKHNSNFIVKKFQSLKWKQNQWPN